MFNPFLLCQKYMLLYKILTTSAVKTLKILFLQLIFKKVAKNFTNGRI